MRLVAALLLVLTCGGCAAHRSSSAGTNSFQADSAAALLRQAASKAGDGREASQRSALVLLLRLADEAARSRKPVAEGYARSFAAQVYINLGRPDSARPFARRAVELLGRKDGDVPPPILTVLGEALQYLGSPDSALLIYRRALPRPADAVSRGDARLLNDIGSAFHQLGNLDSAGTYLERAWALRRLLQDSLGLAATLTNLGRVQQTLARPDSAAILFAAAVPLRRGATDLAGLGATLNNLGYSFDLLHRPAEALDRYREALDALSQAGNLSTTGMVRINMGRAHLALGQMDSALAAVLDGLAIKRAVADSAGVSWGLVDLGLVQRARGDRAAALRAFQDARNVLRVIGDRGREGIVLYELGSLARLPGADADPVGALARFDSAAAIRSSVGAGSRADLDRVSFAEQDLRLFEEWVLGWLDRRDLPPEHAALAALAAAERGRARALLDLMRESSTSLAPGADLIREGRELAAWLTRTGTSALIFLAGRDTLTTWTIASSGEVTVRRLAVGRAELADAVSTFRLALGVETGCDPPRQPGIDLDAASDRLASLLLDDALPSRLPGSGPVLIVPHGPLNLVPFAALPSAGGKPFGALHAVRYAPSLTSAVAAGALPSPLPPLGSDRWSSMQPALVVGNPRMPMLLVCGVRLRPRALPAAEVSSGWLADRLGSNALVGEQATERRVRSDVGAARLIHLETHGFAYENEAGARATFVALASDSGAGQPPPGDGLLTVGEILDQLPRLRAELVVLAACQTGLGDLKDAEGTIGLQRAFLARGARSTLVSLWDVDDRASATLLREFYQQWLTVGSGKAEALRRAQEVVRGMPGFEHPRFWAAFVLAGAD